MENHAAAAPADWQDPLSPVSLHKRHRCLIIEVTDGGMNYEAAFEIVACANQFDPHTTDLDLLRLTALYGISLWDCIYAHRNSRCCSSCDVFCSEWLDPSDHRICCQPLWPSHGCSMAIGTVTKTTVAAKIKNGQ